MPVRREHLGSIKVAIDRGATSARFHLGVISVCACVCVCAHTHTQVLLRSWGKSLRSQMWCICCIHYINRTPPLRDRKMYTLHHD